jgi:hypothetical protein
MVLLTPEIDHVPADPAPTTMKSYLSSNSSVEMSIGLDSGSRRSYWKYAIAAANAGMKTAKLDAAEAPNPKRGAARVLMITRTK